MRQLMIDQSLGWLSIVIEGLRFFLDIFSTRATRRRRRRVSYSRWRFMGERERFELIDDDQS
jgi:hypothetical protein